MGTDRDSLKVLPGDPPIEIVLRRSARARRISLRVSSANGTVSLSVPPGVREGVALAFAESRADWIRGHLARRPAASVVAPGMRIPVFGRDRLIVEGHGRPVMSGDTIRVAPGRLPGPQVAGVLRAVGTDALCAAAERHAATLGRSVAHVTLRDTRSRWGSCTSAGRLMFSWRLVLAPVEVMDYVAAHEVAHLVHMNHAPAFWETVETICPAWRRHRDWLRRHGASLHAWRFA